MLVDGKPATLNELDAFVTPLQPLTAGGTLAAGTVASRIIDGPQLGAGGFFGGPASQQLLGRPDPSTYEFDLPGASWASLTLTMAKPPTSGFAPQPVVQPSAVAVFNFHSEAWDPIALVPGTGAAIASVGQHVSPDGLVLVQLTPMSGYSEAPQFSISGQELGTP